MTEIPPGWIDLVYKWLTNRLKKPAVSPAENNQVRHCKFKKKWIFIAQGLPEVKK